MKRHLTPEQKAALEKLGWDKLMEEFQKRLEEQKGRPRVAANGSAAVAARRSATAAIIPRASRGRPVGRQPHRGQGLEQREYRNLDDTVELGTRNIRS